MAEAVSTSGNGEEMENKNLKDIFLNGWNLFEELESTSLLPNSSEFQNKVKTAMGYFETATQIVSQIDMFSPNELIDEVSTESLQFLLLPYFLGKLTTKLHRQNNLEVLEVAEIYFNDHLQRCSEYDLCDTPKGVQTNAGGAQPTDAAAAAAGGGNELKELMRAANSRNNKIAQFRKMKELDEYISRMKTAIKNESIEDEIKREFFLKFIEKSIMDATAELISLKDLKQMVKMANMRLNAGSDELVESGSGVAVGHHGHSHGHHHQPNKPKPLQPFIITRDATQKTVFGLGYPSLPIMTVDEFYSQRVRDGIFPDEEKVAHMNQAQAIAAAQNENEKEDAENAMLEEQIENDDEENLARMRRMDEYKDVVRRGDGNRHNRS